MASSSRLVRINPGVISVVIIITAVVLFALTVLSIVSMTNQKNIELVNYELKLILEGNGQYLKNENKRDFIQRMGLKDNEFFVKISSINNLDVFESGNPMNQSDGQCILQQYFEFDIKFCRPNPIPWNFLKVVSFCFAGVILVSILILRYLSSEMVVAFKKLFNTANIPHPSQLTYSSAWSVAWEMADRFQAFQMQAIALEKDKATVSLSKQVAHDIRSPLSTINVIISTLGPELQQEKKEILESSVDRINQIAEDLLQKSKLTGHGNKDYSTNSPVKFDQIIKKIVKEKEVQNQIGIRIHLSLDLESKEVSVGIGERDISRILSNILNNAIESIEHKGEVRIALRHFDSFLLLTMMDSGKGIPEHVLAVLGSCEISYGKQNNAGSGNGLGVYHAKRTLESIGGNLVIQSKVGIGTNIEIRIPII